MMVTWYDKLCDGDDGGDGGDGGGGGGGGDGGDETNARGMFRSGKSFMGTGKPMEVDYMDSREWRGGRSEVARVACGIPTSSRGAVGVGEAVGVCDDAVARMAQLSSSVVGADRRARVARAIGPARVGGARRARGMRKLATVCRCVGRVVGRRRRWRGVRRRCAHLVACRDPPRPACMSAALVWRWPVARELDRV